MTNAHDTTGNEATMWTDEAMHAAYKEAFDKDPDAHHWALLSWIRDDMQQALAELEAAADPEALSIAYGKGFSIALDRIRELEKQLAERSEWTDVSYDDIFAPDGEPLLPEYKDICEAWSDFNNEFRNNDGKYEFAICRRVQREDENG